MSTEDAVDPANALTVAFHQLNEEVGGAKATELLSRLEFHPVFTAHPTEARRKAVEGKIRRIARLLEERPYMGGAKATELLSRLEFHPVFTAHPTEARRKAVEGKIRRIARLLEERPYMCGSYLVENERHMLQEIDAIVRTSPIALKKPTPVEEADTIIDIFDSTL